ncbi:MAG: hypothetical protein CVU49_04665 [Candidatus Cloacimonetes bacterium HGW-Cloacimonetes-2]|jgi:hypothetical protein|nr:MAG: hypothetical protein CVU49_04665 [Candidatus Cloacimonetes bacterium HGW-Cloacimonetes-2]
MKKLVLIFGLLVIATLAVAELAVTGNSGDRLELSFENDNWSISQAGEYVSILAPGMSSEPVIGAPRLPYLEFKVAVPYGGEIRVDLLDSRFEAVQLSALLQPGPNMIEQDGIWIADYQVDQAQYRPVERPIAEPLPIASFRGYYFIPVRINAFKYDGQRGLEVLQRARIQVAILGDTGSRATPVTDKLADILMNEVVNPEQARYWNTSFRPTINYADFSRSDWWIKLETDQNGIYRINRSQLSSFPLADVDPRSFRLFTTGGTVLGTSAVQNGAVFREVPIKVVGEEDGAFGSQDYILFYGASRDGHDKNAVVGDYHYYNPYSKTTVYWLTFGGSFEGNPLRIATSTLHESWDQETLSFTETARKDEERYRRNLHGFDWYTARLFGSTNADYSFEINLADVDQSKTQRLRFEIIQEIVSSYVNHYMKVYINGNAVANPGSIDGYTFSWPNISLYTFNREVTGLVNGTNNITIRMIRDRTLNYYLDYLELQYGRTINKADGQLTVYTTDALRRVRYDVTGNTTGIEAYMVNSQWDVSQVPLQSANSYLVTQGIAGSRILIVRPSEYYSPLNLSFIEPTDLTANPSPLDNIIIAPQEYLSQAETIAGIYRDHYGLTTRVIDQQTIFDQFNGGHPDPVALRQYLRYVYHNFSGTGSNRLSSLTLIGLGTIDWVNTSGQSAPRNKVIVYQRGDTQSDDWYGMLTNDSFPELAIGRYPVKTTTELNTMIENFRNYTVNPTPGMWRNSVVMLADDLYNGPNTPYEDVHTEQVQTAAGVLNPSIFTDKVFAWNYPYDEFQNKPGARDRMVQSVNDGKLLWLYVGHGSYDNIGTEDYFNGATDLGRLSNSDKLPVFLAMSCKVSHFDYWGFDSLGQKLVFQQNRGAIASWSASRISFPDQNADMLYIYLNRMINQRLPLGNAIMSTKLAYTGDNYNEAVYVLFGDPHLRAIPPKSILSISPNFADATNTLFSREQATFTGQFNSSTPLSGTAELIAYDTDNKYRLDNLNVSEKGGQIFRGTVSVADNAFQGGFIVPDDIRNGDTASIVAYIWDSQTKTDYTSYFAPMKLSDQAVAVPNTSAPQIELYLSSLDFRAGDTVGETPMLIARISDENGINIAGNAGRDILLVIDGSLQPIAVTGHFSYDLDSYTQGMLYYQLPKLSEGSHTVQLIAFDSFNLPAVASTTFIVKTLGNFFLDRFLIYPNPMQRETSFTFILSDDADLTISIYTIRGRKIRQIETSGRQGFNAIPWDGRDNQGSRIANNTYFVKIRARNSSGTSIEKTERVVVYN